MWLVTTKPQILTYYSRPLWSTNRFCFLLDCRAFWFGGDGPYWESHKKYIYVLVHYFTRWMDAYPLPSKNAEEVTECTLYTECTGLEYPKGLGERIFQCGLCNNSSHTSASTLPHFITDQFWSLPKSWHKKKSVFPLPSPDEWSSGKNERVNTLVLC